jgi:cephalosporin hydroxylase
MATSSRHSLPTQPKSREEKTAWLYNNQFQNRRHKQLTKDILAFIKPKLIIDTGFEFSGY